MLSIRFSTSSTVHIIIVIKSSIVPFFSLMEFSYWPRTEWDIGVRNFTEAKMIAFASATDFYGYWAAVS